MPIRVKVYAPGFINHDVIDQNGYVELAENDSVRILFKKLKITPLARILVTTFVNYEPVKMSAPLKDGDVVSLMFPVAGG